MSALARSSMRWRRSQVERIKRSSVVCFALLLALSTYQKLRSDSKAVALAVELEVASRFILSHPNGLHTDRCRASPDICSRQSSWYHTNSLGYGLVRPSQPLVIHLLALSSTQLDGRSCGFSCPTLLFSFIPDCCLIPHRNFGLPINHKRGAVD